MLTMPSTDAIIADAYFPALRDHIVSSTGLEFYADRPQTLAGHVANRLGHRGLSGCLPYWELLHDAEAGEAELDRLIELLTIGETHFFRHQELFDALRDAVLPEIIRRNRTTQQLRVWSAGCSTGPEPYSVSILLRRDLAHAVRGWQISIVGTDINRPCLAQADEGLYEDWAFRGTPPEFRPECFEQHVGKSWKIRPQYQAGVSFRYHNLACHPFPSLVHNLLAFDLILCRNVLIYFSPEVVHRIVSQMADCLVPGGWLAVGHAEHGAPLQDDFDVVKFPGATLYRKPQQRSGSPAFDLGTRVPDAPIQPSASAVNFASSPFRRPCGLRERPLEPPRPVVQSTVERAAPCEETWASAGIEQIRTLADQGHVDAALVRCEELISKESLNAVYRFYHALLLNQQARDEAALRALNTTVYLDPEFALAHYYLGLTRRKLGHAVGAIKSFRNVLGLIAGLDRSRELPHADGLTAGDLNLLTTDQLETLTQT